MPEIENLTNRLKHNNGKRDPEHKKASGPVGL